LVMNLLPADSVGLYIKFARYNINVSHQATFVITYLRPLSPY
jgi:hypothetical protein